MSSRQKSFFDQAPKPAAMPGRRWQRHTSTGNLPPRSETVPSLKQSMTAPPIAASTQSRSKLKAFMFEDGHEPPTKALEENANNIDKENLGPISSELSNSKSKNLATIPEELPAIVKECPQTPVPRLALTSLLGNNEDITLGSSQGKESAIRERVYWDHSRRSPRSSSLGSSFDTSLQTECKGGKRTKTPSPISSSQPEKATDAKARRESLDLQALQDSLKTPQADPATELWNRYTVKTGMKNSPNASPGAPFAHLLEASSPHCGSALPRGLMRRSLSCHDEWPTSASKRRRTKGPEAERDVNDVFVSRSPAKERSKLSRVSMLMDRIQESFTKDQQPGDLAEPSSSSPLPDRSDSLLLGPVSPLQRRTQPTGIESARNYAVLHQHENNSDGSQPRNCGEYNSKETDANMTNDINASVSDTRKPEAEPTRMTEDDYGDDIMAALVGSDDFGSDDDDFFTADLEDMAARYDQPDDIKSDPPVIQIETLPQPVTETPADAVKEVFAKEQTHFLHSPSSDDDEFGDDDIELEQFVAAEAAATQSSRPSSNQQNSSERGPCAIKRYLVTSLCDGSYMTSAGMEQPEKVLLVTDEKTKAVKAISLRQSWYDTPCTTGSYIHLIGSFDRAGQCVVDDAHNMLILHPDHLISATVVADSFGCMRRAVLQDRVKATNDASAPQVYGHMLHEIFQEAIRANKWDFEWLARTIDEVVLRYMEALYEIHLDVPQASDYLKSKMPELQSWAEVFVSETPNSNALVKDRNGQQVRMSINKLLDVEEHIWSPMYGLKGNVDATVQVVMQDGPNERTLTVPFEVKTGRNTSNAQHRAQTALYTLLLSDRYDVEVAYGILYYMEVSGVFRIPAIRHEIRHMVMQRNRIACFVRDRLQLPPMLKSSHLCGKCYAKLPCFVYHKLVDNGDGESSGMKEKFDEVVRHLKPAHQEFFKKWDDLLTKEEKDSMKFRRELWTMLSHEREKLGRCFANVMIEPGSAFEADSGPKINRFRYSFVKPKASASFSFVESQISVGEPIVISDEKGHFALANGYVTHVRKHRITVAVDRRLQNARIKRPGFDAETNQTFAGIMEVCEDGRPQSTMTQTEADEPILYRLDKDEFSNGMATVRNNLIQTMAPDVFHAREIRELIIEGRAPTFKPSPTAYTLPGSSSQANLNVDQTRAIETVMSAEDYALVLGMPGTGKTTTIAHIIRALVSQGKSVLLTSYTHTAVDNILLKIRHDNIRTLRIGAASKVHPEVQEFANLASIPKESIEEVHESYHAPSVVATTCLGVNHSIFNQRIFDYCIVDEASQITLPVCLGPIRMAKRFILVGDHYQLPPLVQNEEAREGGLDVSLFKFLSDLHPTSVVNLEHQYRMCEDIMLLSNTLIYNGLLKCGTEAVKHRSITIPNMDALKQHHFTNYGAELLSPGQRDFCLGPHRGTCWLRDLLDPSVKVSFVNTDPLLPASREEASGSRVVNHVEANLSTQLVESLLATGVNASEIGVITLYRSQLALIKQNLRHHPDVEMHTADRFQGRDKEVIILSLVRSNDNRQVGDLLRDWRRVNVAFTRARTKLLVLGSRHTLSSNDLLADFLNLIEKKQWRYDLPRSALGSHYWNETLTQASMSAVDDAAMADQVMQQRQESKAQATRKQTKEAYPGGKSAGFMHKYMESGKSGVTGVKTGKMSERVLLGNRPVLRDIINDAI